MPSFQITLTPKRRAATRFINDVRRTLLRALADEKQANGVSQSEVARRLDIHRSVISRELRGRKDIGVGRIGEFAWALGLEPHFELRKPQATDGQNAPMPPVLTDIQSRPAPAKTDMDAINARLNPLLAAA